MKWLLELLEEEPKAVELLEEEPMAVDKRARVRSVVAAEEGRVRVRAAAVEEEGRARVRAAVAGAEERVPVAMAEEVMEEVSVPRSLRWFADDVLRKHAPGDTEWAQAAPQAAR